MFAFVLLFGCGLRDDGCPTVYRDEDGDGFGSGAWVTCLGPTPGWVTDGGDCDDEDPERHPDARSRCDGVDYDCDGDPGVVLNWHRDQDGDGYGDPSPTHGCSPPGTVADNADDCDDRDSDEHPGAVWFYDGDQDDYGVDDEVVTACERPSATWAPEPGDCDDADPDTHPNAQERCDDEDDDCDGVVDDDPVDMTTWYTDADGDGWGGDAVEACERPADVVDTDGDCDDADASTWPGAPEPDCDDPVDHNCDGSAGLADADGDGAVACLDCDDGDASRGSTLPETCDGQDDDCDGETDESDAVDATAWYTDLDGDGYGTDLSGYACRGGPRLADEDGDCDDDDATRNPGAREDCATDTDEDCDGDTNDRYALGCTDWYPDADGDGYGGEEICTCTMTSASAPNEYDCDDGDAAVSPDATEVCGDGVDDDCGGSPECGVAGDLDLEDAAATLYGASSGGSRFGAGLSALDDLDGDGIDELLVGASSLSGKGGAYVFSAPFAGLTTDDALATLTGETASAYAGETVAGLGDVDGDGVADLLVGAPYDSSYTGLVYLVSGADLSGELALADQPARVGSAASDYLGDALAAPGDVDGDGLADVLAGARGADAAYLWCGGFTGRQGPSDATATFVGSGGDATGYAVAGADLDGDGHSDVAVGAPYADGYVGAVRVFWGPLAGTIAEADADVVLGGTVAGGHLGVALAPGDTDGDGLPDLAIAASGWSSSGGYGAVYLFAGPFGDGDTDDATARYLGASGERAGETLALVDLDADGRQDLVASNVFSSSSTYGVRVFVSPLSGDLGESQATVRGEHADYLGRAFTGLSDTDGDGFDELWVGAISGEDSTGTRTGLAALFLGGVGS